MAKQIEEEGSLILSYATGQTLRIPLKAAVATPFITASSPRLTFGVCHVTQSCHGTLILSNPTNVPARWSLAHVPGAGSSKKATAIRVEGFDNDEVEVDDPTVFEITPTSGNIEGPTVSVAAATSAPPKDPLRRYFIFY